MNELEKIEVLKQTELCGLQFKVYGTADEPLFLAKDIASLLNLTNVTDMVSRVEKEELTKLNLGGRQGETWFLSEDGLYEVLMQSRKPIAKQFKKGVKAILKEIRKKGEMYNQPTQKALDMALFETKKTIIQKPSGQTLVATTTKVTGQGQVYFVNKFLA